MIKKLIIAAALAVSLTSCTPVQESEPGYKPYWHNKLTVVQRFHGRPVLYKGPSGACYLHNYDQFSIVNCEDFIDE